MTEALAIPESPAELEEWLHDDVKLTKVNEEKKLPEFIRAYVQKVAAKDPSIAAQVREQTQLALAEFYEQNEVASSNRLDLSYHVNNRAAKRAAAKAPGAPLNGLFDSPGEFLKAVWTYKRNGKMDDELAAKMAKVVDYSERVPSEGGFLVPEEFRTELMVPDLGAAVVRPRAQVIPMSTAKLHIPKVDETSRVSSVFGGVVVYRTEEAAELVESGAKFSAISLEATKQTVLAHVSNELLKDVPAFDAFIRGTFGPAVGFYEDIDFLTGSGVGEPLGALNRLDNEAIIAITKESGQAAATVVWQNVIRMYARMLPSSIARAVWLASPDVFVELATMALSVGTGGSAVWLADAHGTPVLTLLGRPVIMTEKAPAALGTQGDLSFVDFGMYLVGDRQTLQIESSPHVKFTSDRTTFRGIARNDGRPWMEQPITPANNSATLSAYVQLETR